CVSVFASGSSVDRLFYVFYSLAVSLFFFYCYRDHRGLHSFPTRRSSDLLERVHVRLHPQRHAAVADVPHRRGQPGTSATAAMGKDRKSTRLNSSHGSISYAVFCLKKKKTSNGMLSWFEKYTTLITASI